MQQCNPKHATQANSSRPASNLAHSHGNAAVMSKLAELVAGKVLEQWDSCGLMGSHCGTQTSAPAVAGGQGTQQGVVDQSAER
eukprot:scaffold238884_cov19-Tisochrysis_lutea.AAC.3